MSIFDDLGNIFTTPRQQKETIAIPSVMPLKAVQCINNNSLPVLNTKTIFLSTGEVCHYIEHAILVTVKNMITGYSGGSNGWSFRVMKGVNYRTGKRTGTPIREDVQENTKGILYITNKRIIFAARKNAFDKKRAAITSITPYSNGIVIQSGNTSNSILLPDGNLAFNVVNLLK